MRNLFLICLVFCTVLLTTTWAQVNTAQINGTVTDSSGAVVPNANITVSNPDMALTRNAKSNEAGNYNFPFLPPATYQLRLEARVLPARSKGMLQWQ